MQILNCTLHFEIPANFSLPQPCLRQMQGLGSAGPCVQTVEDPTTKEDCYERDIRKEQLQEILERKQAELMGGLRNRDGITIEKSGDQMDEIQYATERDLAIRNVDRDSKLLRQVKAALIRVHAGHFGTCLDCEESISPKRLAAVPWAGDALTVPGNFRSRQTGRGGS